MKDNEIKKARIDGRFKIAVALIGAFSAILIALLPKCNTPPSSDELPTDITVAYTLMGEIIDSKTHKSATDIEEVFINNKPAHLNLRTGTYTLSNYTAPLPTSKFSITIKRSFPPHEITHHKVSFDQDETMIRLSPIKVKQAQKSSAIKPKPKPRNSKSTEPPRPKEKKKIYFNPTNKVDIAIISLTQDDDFYDIVRQHFSAQNMNTSTSFFRPIFYQDWSNQIRSNDFSLYQDLNVKNNINCICKIKSNISFIENQDDGGSFITAKGTFAITILELMSEKKQVFPISLAGAGINQSRAKRSLMKKFKSSLGNTKFNLSPCKK